MRHKGKKQKALCCAGERSVARRLLRCAAPLLSDAHTTRMLTAANSASDIEAVMRRQGAQFPELQRLASVVTQKVTAPEVGALQTFPCSTLKMCSNHDAKCTL